jgi:hypothetical protein
MRDKNTSITCRDRLAGFCNFVSDKWERFWRWVSVNATLFVRRIRSCNWKISFKKCFCCWKKDEDKQKLKKRTELDMVDEVFTENSNDMDPMYKSPTGINMSKKTKGLRKRENVNTPNINQTSIAVVTVDDLTKSAAVVIEREDSDIGDMSIPVVNLSKIVKVKKVRDADNDVESITSDGNITSNPILKDNTKEKESESKSDEELKIVKATIDEVDSATLESVRLVVQDAVSNATRKINEIKEMEINDTNSRESDTESIEEDSHNNTNSPVESVENNSDEESIPETPEALRSDIHESDKDDSETEETKSKDIESDNMEEIKITDKKESKVDEEKCDDSKITTIEATKSSSKLVATNEEQFKNNLEDNLKILAKLQPGNKVWVYFDTDKIAIDNSYGQFAWRWTSGQNKSNTTEYVKRMIDTAKLLAIEDEKYIDLISSAKQGIRGLAFTYKGYQEGKDLEEYLSDKEDN